MPRKEYGREFLVPVSPDSHIRFRFDVGHGGIDDFVVQYELQIGDRLYQVVRYDCAHGYPHRDILDPRGRVTDKQALPRGISRKEAMQFAHQDLRANWAMYRDDFIRREAHERANPTPDVRARRPAGKRRARRRRR